MLLKITQIYAVLYKIHDFRHKECKKYLIVSGKFAYFIPMKKLLPILLIMVACSNNDNDPEPKQPSRTELLISVKWNLVSIGGQAPADEFVFEFKSDKSLKITTHADITTGTWSLLNSDKTIRISTNGNDLNYPIVELTTDTFIYKDEQNQDNLFHPL